MPNAVRGMRKMRGKCEKFGSLRNFPSWRKIPAIACQRLGLVRSGILPTGIPGLSPDVPKHRIGEESHICDNGGGLCPRIERSAQPFECCRGNSRGRIFRRSDPPGFFHAVRPVPGASPWMQHIQMPYSQPSEKPARIVLSLVSRIMIWICF